MKVKRALWVGFFHVIILDMAVADEVQQHGLVFEAWVRDTFFDGYKPPSYTQKWDIPAAVNQRHGSIPVNRKTTKDHTPVDLGDALRQFDIDEPFILIIGYWRQDGDQKRFVNIIAPRIEPTTWRKLWGPVIRADLGRLDAIIKNHSLDPAEARRQAQAIKNAPPLHRIHYSREPQDRLKKPAPPSMQSSL